MIFIVYFLIIIIMKRKEKKERNVRNKYLCKFRSDKIIQYTTLSVILLVLLFILLIILHKLTLQYEITNIESFGEFYGFWIYIILIVFIIPIIYATIKYLICIYNKGEDF